MSEDPRCCGSGTCIIDAQGRCWCGQRWDGEKMCHEAKPSLEVGAGAGGNAEPQRPPVNVTGEGMGSRASGA